jgi:hypothetical protein
MGRERRGSIGWAKKMIKKQVGELLGLLSYVLFFSAQFVLTKIGFFVTQKGPHTHIIVYSSFVKIRRSSRDNKSRGIFIVGLRISLSLI